MDDTGAYKELDSKESAKFLDSDFFSGSIAISKDANHSGFVHKLIYIGQKIRALFSSSRQIDPELCHAMIVLKNGTKPPDSTSHPFYIAHSDPGGIRIENYDYLSDPTVTDLVIYRPRDPEIRSLYKVYASMTAYTEEEATKTFFSPTQRPHYSYWDMFFSLFQRKRHAIYEKKIKSEEITKRTSYLVADFFLQNQIKNPSGKPMSFICSGFVSSVLQGTLIVYGLKGQTMKEISDFIYAAGPYPHNRDRLAKKIKKCFLKDHPNDHVAHSLWNAFRQNKLTNYNSRFAMPAYIARSLDKLSFLPPVRLQKSQ